MKVMPNNRAPIVHAPGVLRIPLTKGMFALIDEADAPLVEPHLWCALKTPHTHYAVRTTKERRTVYMHRVILCVENGVEVDHADNDGLNNRRGNLRAATRSQNAMNTRLRADNSTGLRGVTFKSDGFDRPKPFEARVTINGKPVCLGCFATAEEASAAYTSAIAQAYGMFASPHISRES